MFALLALCIYLATADRTYLEKTSAPTGLWSQRQRVSNDQPLELIFALKQTNLKQLEAKFWAVSDPDSPLYGKFLTQDEVQQLVKPTRETVSAVKNWLSQFPVTSVHLNDHILVTAPAYVAEEMLQCQFFWFHHPHSSKPIIRSATDYSLPSYIAPHVDFVGGVKHFPKINPPLKSNKPRPDFDFEATPRLLKDLYNIGNAVGVAKNNSQAVAQFLGQYFSKLDLQEFFALLLQSAIGNSPTEVGPNNLVAGVEASLDIEYIMSTGQNIPTTFWSTGGLHENQEPFYKWLIDIDNTKNPPILFSVSYGDDEPSLTAAYLQRTNTEFMKQGLRGISFLFASGDSGVGGDDFSACSRFVPGYPATSPYVTAVGGTDLDGWFETGHEIVNGLSGGGFSDVFARPAYQTAAVQNYLKEAASTLPAQSFWNATGRGFPDIAALSANFLVVANFIPLPGVAGTSCAAPTISGIFGLLNDIRLQNGKPQLGFLNPLLYKLAVTQPQVFTDITVGSNPGCGQDGFQAAKGWDPATGFGSVNYAEFAKIILSI